MVAKAAPKHIMTSPRDRELLSFVGRAGIASFGQIHQRHWPGCHQQTCAKRLQSLKQAGLLTLHYTNARGARERVYALTTQGARVLPDAERPRARIGLAPRAEHTQQLLAQDYRIRLEQEVAAQGGRVVEWWDERELKSEQQTQRNKAQRAKHTPTDAPCADARAVIAYADGRQETVEIEIDGHYYGKMLTHKLQGLAGTQKPVRYVCLPERAARIQQEAARYTTITVVSL